MNLLSLRKSGLKNVIKGMYEGKPLLVSEGRPIDANGKRIDRDIAAGRNGYTFSRKDFGRGRESSKWYISKTMKTASGSFELEVLRDRNGSSES